MTSVQTAKSSGRGRIYLNLSVSAVAFFMTSAIVNRLLPEDPAPFQAGLEYLRQVGEGGDINLENYNVLFVGSSFTQWNIDPRAFGELLGNKGYDVRAFALGVNGFQGHGVNKLVKEILRARPEGLEVLVIDMTQPFSAKMPKTYQDTPRMIWWHDLSETVSAVRPALFGEFGAYEKIQLLALHLRHFSKNWGPPRGRFLAYWERRWTVEEALGEEAEGQLFSIESNAGHSPPWFDAETFEAERNPRKTDLAAELAQRLGDTIRLNGEEIEPEGRNVGAVGAQVGRLRRYGITPVHVVFPATINTKAMARSDTRYALSLHRDGTIPHLFYANDPARYPELFELENRWDGVHLNQRGTEILTQEFADYFEEEILGGNADLEMQLRRDPVATK